MDLYEVAKKMELEGKSLYEEQLNKTSDPGLKNILGMLAKQEQEHYNVFDALQKNEKVIINHNDFKGVKDLFKSVRETTNDQEEFYKKVLEVERASEEFYKEIAEKQGEQKTKETILRIAREEHKHGIIIKNILEHIRKPHQWVEDSEFNHLEDY